MPEGNNIYQQLNKMKFRILKDESQLSQLKNKDVLVLFGTTGSGKSTLANAIINGVGNITKEKETGYYILNKVLKNEEGETIF